MKRMLLFVCAFCILLLSGCQEPDPVSSQSQPGETSALSSLPELDQVDLSLPEAEPVEEKPEPEEAAVESGDFFTFTEPVIMAEHHFADGIVPGQPPATLYLEITEGTYDASQASWNNIWNGPSRFRVSMEGREDIISEGGYHFGFYEPFELAVTDYNNDGQPDFVIGQWGAMSAGDVCAMFTVNPDGTVDLVFTMGDWRRPTAFGLVDIDEANDVGIFFLPHLHHPSPLLEALEEETGFAVIHTASRGPENLFLPDALAQLDQWITKTGMATYTGRIRDIYLWDSAENCYTLTRQELLDI